MLKIIAITVLLISPLSKAKSNDLNFFGDLSYSFGITNNSSAFINDGVNGSPTSDTVDLSSFNTFGGSIGISYKNFFFRTGYESINNADISGTVTFSTTRTLTETDIDLTNWSFSIGKFFNVNEKLRVYPQAGIGIANIELPGLSATDGVVLSRADEDDTISWSLGFGGDYQIFDKVSSFVEYNFTDYGDASLLDPTVEFKADGLEVKNHAIKIGLRYNF